MKAGVLYGAESTQQQARPACDMRESCEAVGHRTLNSLQHHEGAAAVVVICDSVAPFLKMNSASGTAPL